MRIEFVMHLLETLPPQPVLLIKNAGEKPPVKKRPGRTPDIMRKGGPMKDKSKYDRKPKHRRKYGPEGND